MRDFLPQRPSLFSLPSTLEIGHAWWMILETLPHQTPGLLMRYEYRYPYLDRDLVDFLLCVPREQLVQPGRRRALMRRALKSILPVEILERRRKAYLSRSPMVSTRQGYRTIKSLLENSCSGSQGFIDEEAARNALCAIVEGEKTEWCGPMLRTVLFELWLRSAPIKALNDARDPSLISA